VERIEESSPDNMSRSVGEQETSKQRMDNSGDTKDHRREETAVLVRRKPSPKKNMRKQINI
jgi:hypothetical protein